MTECSICLQCRISEWSYHRDLSLRDPSSDERLLSLSGETEFQGFIDRMPFDIRILSGPFDTVAGDEVVLELNEAMPDYNIPQNLSALIPITASQFDDLRLCLLHVSKAPASTVSLTLTIEGLRKTRNGEERIFPIEGRKVEIVSFAWQLSSDGVKR